MPEINSGAAREFYDRIEVTLRAGFITGLPRFARNDGDAGLVLERGSLNSGLCVVHCSVRPELGRWMSGSRAAALVHGSTSSGSPRTGVALGVLQARLLSLLDCRASLAM